MKSSNQIIASLASLSPRQTGGLPPQIKGFSSDSRMIKEGYLFSILKGNTSNGECFIAEALSKGARILICEEFLDVAIPQICVDDIRKANALLASLFHDDVQKELKLIALTGTNGKSSTAFIIHYLLGQVGKISAITGTLGCGVNGTLKRSSLTTPGAEELHAFFEDVHEQGAEYVVLEASSHGLEQERLHGLSFEAVLFTNLSEDHLQYHGSMEEYFSAKKKLFENHESKIQVINSDDNYGQRLLGPLSKTFAKLTSSDCQVLGKSIRIGDIEIQLPQLIGEYNIYNAAGAVLLVKELLGETYLDSIKIAMENFPGVPGRMELFEKMNGAKIIVDFAHAEESLEQVIKEVRKNCKGKLYLTFGCGGDRDRGRRTGMGKASDLADEVIITNDNPRNEDPQSIIDDILAAKRKSARIILDREQAIRWAWGELNGEDYLVIAGKGHEEVQIFKDKNIYFSDRSLCRQIIEEESEC